MKTVVATEGQLPLLAELLPIVAVPGGQKVSLDERFSRFHELNPQVFALFRQLTWQMVQRGRRRVGAKMIWERLRWEYALLTEEGDYKLNNNYTSRYARLVMASDPALTGIFETRELRS